MAFFPFGINGAFLLDEIDQYFVRQPMIADYNWFLYYADEDVAKLALFRPFCHFSMVEMMMNRYNIIYLIEKY